jgi:BlaI family transcriptional regulator, penicillinase repressor
VALGSMDLGYRERQILEILYRLGGANVAQVRNEIPNPPTYSAVRGMLRILEQKKLVKHRQEKIRYLYYPTVSRTKAAESALKHMVDTFFDGSVEDVMIALLQIRDRKFSCESIERLQRMIRRASSEGR